MLSWVTARVKIRGYRQGIYLSLSGYKSGGYCQGVYLFLSGYKSVGTIRASIFTAQIFPVSKIWCFHDFSIPFQKNLDSSLSLIT